MTKPTQQQILEHAREWCALAAEAEGMPQSATDYRSGDFDDGVGMPLVLPLITAYVEATGKLPDPDAEDREKAKRIATALVGHARFSDATLNDVIAELRKIRAEEKR